MNTIAARFPSLVLLISLSSSLAINTPEVGAQTSGTQQPGSQQVSAQKASAQKMSAREVYPRLSNYRGDITAVVGNLNPLLGDVLLYTLQRGARVWIYSGADSADLAQNRKLARAGAFVFACPLQLKNSGVLAFDDLVVSGILVDLGSKLSVGTRSASLSLQTRQKMGALGAKCTRVS